MCWHDRGSEQHHTATGCGAGDPQCAHISILRAPGSDPEDRPKALLSITLLLTPAVTRCRAAIPAGGKVPAGYGHRHLQHCCTVLQQHPAQRHAAGRVQGGDKGPPHPSTPPYSGCWHSCAYFALLNSDRNSPSMAWAWKLWRRHAPSAPSAPPRGTHRAAHCPEQGPPIGLGCWGAQQGAVSWQEEPGEMRVRSCSSVQLCFGVGAVTSAVLPPDPKKRTEKRPQYWRMQMAPSSDAPERC